MTVRQARAALSAGVMAWLAIGVLLATVAAGTVPALVVGTATTDDGVAALAATAGLVVLGWLALAVGGTALVGVRCRRGHRRHILDRWSAAVTPAVVRRLVTLAVTGALVAGTAPAQAADGPVPAPPVVAVATLDPGWGALSRPAATEQRPPAVGPARADRRQELDRGLDPSWGEPARMRPGAYPPSTVVVRRGDTLWDIAARHLGPSATDAEIAHAWPRWYETNRRTIGPDPDRLRPGQRLHPPSSRAGGTS